MGSFVQGAWVEPEWPTESLCNRCGKCCQYTWHTGKTDIGKEFLRAKGYREGNDGVFYAYSPCKECRIEYIYGGAEGRHTHAICQIQNHKPQICRDHGSDKNHFYPDGCAYRDFVVEHQIECKTLRMIRGCNEEANR